MHTKKNNTAGMKYSYFCYLVNNRRKKKPTMDGNSIEYIHIDLDFFNICIFVSLRERA